MNKKKSPHKKSSVNIGGNVNIKSGDFVGRDKKINVNSGSIYVDGDVKESILNSGNDNRIVQQSALREELFDAVLEKINQEHNISLEDKKNLEINVRDIQSEAGHGENANESFLVERLQNIKRMAPDIADVVLATLTNPSAGFAMIVKKVAERVARD